MKNARTYRKVLGFFGALRANTGLWLRMGCIDHQLGKRKRDMANVVIAREFIPVRNYKGGCI
jgi:hypothetical protein